MLQHLKRKNWVILGSEMKGNVREINNQRATKAKEKRKL